MLRKRDKPKPPQGTSAPQFGDVAGQKTNFSRESLRLHSALKSAESSGFSARPLSC